VWRYQKVSNGKKWGKEGGTGAKRFALGGGKGRRIVPDYSTGRRNINEKGRGKVGLRHIKKPKKIT